MKLIPVSERPDAVKILWDLLAERTPDQSISHKAMPTWVAHAAFVDDMEPSDYSKSYQAWHLIEVAGDIVGSIYLTRNSEIGVSIFRTYQRKGYGAQAVQALMAQEGTRRYLANVNPANAASKAMWQKLGFAKIQETYALEN